LVGSKIDVSERVISQAEAEDFARENMMTYWEVSSKDYVNINEVMTNLTEKIKDEYDRENSRKVQVILGEKIELDGSSNCAQ
jgi:hypothetical protein